MATYGKVPVKAFDAARAKLGAAPETDHTFREDYEFYGAEEGTVTAHYGGRCTECGLNVKFRHDEVVWTAESAAGGPVDDDREDER